MGVGYLSHCKVKLHKVSNTFTGDRETLCLSSSASSVDSVRFYQAVTVSMCMCIN
jgi:hypothetical protein